jgi:hypothetical protein
MWIAKYVTGSLHDKFEVVCGLEQMIEEDAITKFEVHCGLEQI